MKYFPQLCALVISAVAVPTAHEYQIHEHRDFLSSVWIEHQRLDGNTHLPVRIGLTQSNLDQGHDLLMELYGLISVDKGIIN